MSTMTPTATIAEMHDTLTTKSLEDGIGSQTDNIRFLVWLALRNEVDIIEKGCSLCRFIGHPFTQACRL